MWWACAGKLDRRLARARTIRVIPPPDQIGPLCANFADADKVLVAARRACRGRCPAIETGWQGRIRPSECGFWGALGSAAIESSSIRVDRSSCRSATPVLPIPLSSVRFRSCSRACGRSIKVEEGSGGTACAAGDQGVWMRWAQHRVWGAERRLVGEVCHGPAESAVSLGEGGKGRRASRRRVRGRCRHRNGSPARCGIARRGLWRGWMGACP